MGLVELDDVGECSHLWVVEGVEVVLAASFDLTAYDIVHEIVDVGSAFVQPLLGRSDVDWMYDMGSRLPQ